MEASELLARLEESGDHPLRRILEGIRDFVLVLDREGNILYTNHRTSEEHWREHVRGKSVFRPDWLSAEAQERMREALRAAFEERRGSAFEILGAGVADPNLRHWYSMRVHPMTSGDAVVGAIYLSSEITERKEAERLIEKQETLQRAILDAIGDGVFALRPDGRIILWNAAMEKMTGVARDELVGRDVPVWERFETLPREAIREIAAGVADGTRVRRERTLPDRTGAGGERRLVGHYHSLPGLDEGPGIVATIRDVTAIRRAEEDRERMREEALAAQKLESLGVLAGGIAHDFNNLLVAILGYAELAREDLATNPAKAVGPLAHIENAASRAADLCRQLLAYSGKGRFMVHAVDVNRTVKDMCSLLQVSISKKATLAVDLADEALVVEADASQIGQIVMNLIINASESLGDRGGAVAVRTRPVEAKDGGGGEISPGRYVEIEVEDNGCGMDAATSARVFDPFFTTKFAGRGLGLAAVQGIVRGHGGTIRVRSEPGRGTLFRILLPRVERDPIAAVAPGNAAAARRGKALVVDDEPSVREFLAAALGSIGFETTAAMDGQDAMEKLRREPDAFLLVVLDLTMPRLDGVETLRALRPLAPSARVILSSGYGEQELTDRLGDAAPDAFLQKPYSLTSLRAAVNRALDA